MTTNEAKAEALLTAVKAVKGRFAQALTKTLEPYKKAGNEIKAPEYIADAIEWTTAMGTPVAGPAPPGPTADPAAGKNPRAQTESESPTTNG